MNNAQKILPGMDGATDACDLGQFYTDPALAVNLVKRLLKRRFPANALFVEPAAGRGAFVKPLRHAGCEVLAVDIDPQAPGIRRGNFLTDSCIPAGNRQVVVVGNPPFGFASCSAIKFFNKAATRAEVIAFILPRTFRKESVQGKLDCRFHCVHDEDIPRLAFVRGNKPHDVPCVFQVWVRRDTLRKHPPTPDISHLIRFTTPDKAHFGLRRVGGRAGCILPGTHHTASTTYFIRGIRPGIRKVMAQLDWNHIREQTAGVRSVSKREIALKLLEAVDA